MSWWWRWFARPDLAASFRDSRDELQQEFLRVAGSSGLPRGLVWKSVEPLAEPTLVRDGRQFVALWPMLVQFEVPPGSALEDVPQALEPRPIVAMFYLAGRRWRTDGKAIFNLTVDEVIHRGGGKFRCVE